MNKINTLYQKIVAFFRWFFKKALGHIEDFSLVWIALAVIFLGVVLPCKIVAYFGLVLILCQLFLNKSMNLVYGLIGTNGSIRVFFAAFIVISVLFSCIYYFGFFNKAGLCYDVNQPHIRFGLYQDEADTVPRKRTVKLEDTVDTIFIHNVPGVSENPYVLPEAHKYQPITYGMVLRNTLMTSLIQEPSDLFAAAAIHNRAMYDDNDSDKSREGKKDWEMVTLFHWILILQILISWILLGVFISILYNKFRYES